MSFLWLCLITFLALAGNALSVSFTVYEDPGRTSTPTFLWWGGGASEKFTVSGSECMNLDFYNNKISSIDPHGGCVKVWENRNCNDVFSIITDKSGCSKNLEACDIWHGFKEEVGYHTWDKKISSISACSIAEEAEANSPVDNGDLKNDDLVLVKSNDAETASGALLLNVIRLWKHRNRYFSVYLCKYTTCKRQERINAQAEKNQCANFGSTWDRQVSAVKPIFDCVEMFDGRDCSGESIKFKKSVYWFSAEQPNPCRMDLSTCKLENGQSWPWNNRIRSMRRCLD